MQVRVGTSGFSYKEWKGAFYPEGLKNKDMLRYYATQLPTVEINNTFYRMPKAAMLEKWESTVPEDFRFVLKGSQRITHKARLKDADDSVQYLFRQAEALGNKLGPVLFQLPPWLKKDVERLKVFLPTIPEGQQVALEFRHASWFDDEVYEVLRQYDTALCIADFDDPDKGAPLVATARVGYLRLRAEDYSEDALASWAESIQAQPWTEVYVFFKHEDEAAAPRLARRLMDQLGTDAVHPA
jgi:uncharacterized protein YecE (DUF72 family)